MMKKRNALTLLLAVSLAVPTFGMTGCGKKDVPVKSKPTNVYRSEVLAQIVENYGEAYESAPTTEYFNSLYRAGDGVVLSTYTYDENWNSTNHYYLFDGETGEKSELTLNIDTDNGNAWVNSMQFTDSGNVWYNLYSYTYDEETGMDSEENRIICMGADGTELYNEELSVLLPQKENEYSYLQEISAVGDSVLLVTNTGVVPLMMQPDGTVNAAKPLAIDGANGINRVLPLDDSCMIFYYDQEYNTKSVSYSFATGAITEGAQISTKARDRIYSAVPSDTYDFVYSDTVGIYGYDIATDTETELLNWVNSDIDATNTNGTYVMPDGTVYCITYEYENNKNTTSLLRLTRVPDEEVVEKYILTFGGTYMDYDVRKAIIAFNKQSEEYRITVRDYSQYSNEDNDYTGALTQLTNDIISGNCPDILMVSADLPYDSYAGKGLFIDLMPYLEADTEIDASDIYENILNAAKSDGKLCQIFTRFTIETLIGKTSVVGDRIGWTMADMNAALAKLYGTTEGVDPFGGIYPRDEFLTSICYIVRDQFVNKDTGECAFDSEEFVNILKFCKTLPEKSIYEDIDWDTVSDDFWIKRDFIYRNDEAMLANFYFSSYKNFWTEEQGVFGEDISFVGFPTATANSSAFYASASYAVSSQCKNPEGAWAFLADLLKKEQERDTENDQYEFSVFRSVNAKLAQLALDYHESNEWGDIYAYSSYYADDAVGVTDSVFAPIGTDTADDENAWYYYLGNDQINIGRMTQKAVDKCNALLESVSQFCRADNDMLAIIKEEASAFFSGQKSAEETAKLIQSRVSLYVSEQR